MYILRFPFVEVKQLWATIERDKQVNSSYTPTLASPHLARAGVASYHSGDPALLATWLESRGWQRADGRSTSEYARLWLGPQLVVLYHSGTALIQGLQPEATHALLSTQTGAE